ncbi:hypothetical protein VTN49DRAFT_8076 [Thermomyces lanuginosus]|uniref:uncharacterized protein n=1 Tax=Thermomyces lanuginosus TaxID=5541 RepID=UPI003742C1C6
MARPVEPNLADYPLRSSLTSTASPRGRASRAGSRVSRAASRASAIPAPDLGNILHQSRPLSIIDLSPEGQTAYNAAVRHYNTQITLYKQQREYITQLLEWVRETVEPSLYDLTCKSEHDIHVWYENLKERAGIKKTEEARQAKQQYEQAVKPLRHRPRDMLAWIRIWESALLKAQDTGIPGLQESQQNQELNETNEGTSDSTARKRPRQVNKRPDIECPACTGRHALKDCWYARPEIRPPNAKIDKAKEALVTLRLQTDEELRRQVEMLRRQARQNQNALHSTQHDEQYPLKRSVILDSGSTLHVFNSPLRFVRLRSAPSEEKLWAGDGRLDIKGYGDVDLFLTTPTGYKKLRLRDVAFVPELATNVVSLHQLEKTGIWWDMSQRPSVLRERDGRVLALVQRAYNQYVLELQLESEEEIFATYYVRRHLGNSWTKRHPPSADAIRWHLRLGHPGPVATEELLRYTEGVRVRGIKTYECDARAMGKMKRQIRRLARDLWDYKPGEKVAVDFHDYPKDAEGFKALCLFTDRVSGFMWDYYLQSRSEASITAIFDRFLRMMQIQLKTSIRAVECDNEITRIKPDIKDFLETKGIKVEPAPPRTQDLNGAAERSGGVVKDKARTMALSANLPKDLWREVCMAAVYLLNRTPRWRVDWRTPYEVLYSTPHVTRRPDLRNLRVYGCKAYAMTKDTMLKRNRLKRFNPRAWIGYLVGYASSNTYRIWNPVEDKVVVTRDVIFNEDEIFPGKIEDLRNDVRELDRGELARLLEQYSLPPVDIEEQEAARFDRTTGLMNGVDPLPPHFLEPDELLFPQEIGATGGSNGDAQMETTASLRDGLADTGVGQGFDHATEVESLLDTRESDDRREAAPESDCPANDHTTDVAYPTPPPSTPASLLLAVMTGSAYRPDGAHRSGESPGAASAAAVSEGMTQGVQHSTFSSAVVGVNSSTGQAKLSHVDSWKAVFNGATRSTVVKDPQTDSKSAERNATKSSLLRRIQKGERVHRREFPEPPKNHNDLDTHPLGELFRDAEKDHLGSHAKKESWTMVSVQEPRKENAQILDCGWVYTYKFDKHGRFVKVKARLVVRGNQQARHLDENNYAATLAGRSFRTMMAIAARFDLDLLQFDAVNAFVNADLDQTVYMKMPPGYRQHGMVLRLRKALYGLRRSPRLWQHTLSKALRWLGFDQIPQEPCIFVRNGIVIFFYVDDIVVAYKRDEREEAIKAITRLRNWYELTGENELHWFLGIRVLRDRAKGKIWLSQAAYIDKISRLAETTTKSDTPMAREELLTFEGEATKEEIRSYQRKINSLLYVAVMTRPDIAFAVSRLSRFMTNPGPEHHKAADRVLRYLYQTRDYGLQFGGEDDLRVASDASFADNTQDRKNTVTTSTTEAELLALAQAAKEGIYLKRLLDALTVSLDSDRIRIEVDNTQTKKLITDEIKQLNTKLKHVDIHNHWLRQEYERRTIDVRHTRSAEIMADGFTKALQQREFKQFRKQLGVVNIGERLDLLPDDVDDNREEHVEL